MYARKEMTDVFVIGGGPAGLAAAIAARRRGFSVAVADGAEPAIDKACGEGLMPESRGALSDLGVQLPPGVGYHFRGIRFLQGPTHVAADFPEGRGIGLRRTLLHQALLDEAERCGVKLLWKTPVIGIDKYHVQLSTGVMPARWIVGADGSQSRVRRWSELDSSVTSSHRFASRRHYHVRPWNDFMEIHWGPRIQAYVTPISFEEVCIVVMGETTEDTDFERALPLFPQLRDRLSGAEIASRERGAVTAMQSLARVWRGNVALVGDASGGVDAITGEGLRLAFRQAHALAASIETGNLREYGRVHAQIARKPLWIGKLMRNFGQYDHLRQRTLRVLAKDPELFSRFLAIHVGRATTGNVVSTGAQLGWQFLAS